MEAITPKWITADDGQRLAADEVGSGTAIVCANGIGVDTCFWKYIRTYFRDTHRVVTWDYRGHGRSPVPEDLATMTIGQMAEDMRAVLDGLGIERAVLVGHSMGRQVILEFYRRYPERTLALIPMLGTYGKPVHTFFDQPVLGRLFPWIYPLLRRAAGPIGGITHVVTRGPLAFEVARRLGILNPCLCKREDMEPYFDHLAQLDMRVFMALLGDMAEHTTDDLLEKIAVPTLIIGGEKDLFTPVWLSHEMHERIPESELLIVPGGSHAALVEQPELINLRIEKFLR